ncbi:hypothetical protein RN001_007636 [Aquatica leii]|uniref:Uncharacterized protein n=1 Tax=Aquatica leii TaxID=1421715 RepID=A0AAN7P361_9COLE|nr:hypothetical protein RN001_007636 [Aquatica leii]
MPQSKTGKNKKAVSRDGLREAVNDVSANHINFREAAQLHNINSKVLQKESSDNDNIEIPTQDTSSNNDNYLEKVIEEANVEMETEIEIDNTSISVGDFVLLHLGHHHASADIKHSSEAILQFLYPFFYIIGHVTTYRQIIVHFVSK